MTTDDQSRLRVLMPGLGAVATTFMAGVMLARKGLGRTVGSLTQHADLHDVAIHDLVTPLEGLDFGAWDVFPANALDRARRAGVLGTEHLEAIADELTAVEPRTAVFDPRWAPALSDATTHLKAGDGLMDLAEQLMADIEEFRKDGERLVMVWCGSTEAYSEPGPAHRSISDFELALKESDPSIAPSQVYAYAAIRSGVPFANGAPNLTVDTPALIALAESEGVPVAGKDFKTGQTLIKTIVAPGLRARRLGIKGWFSTNILGNLDGLVLDHPDNFRSKEVTKMGVLEELLEPEAHPELYGDLTHMVRINYYPPKGDDKEGWDNIDLYGWLDYPMQLKINFLCRDSILAAPIVLDLARLLDLANRSDRSGIQDWLGFYFKSPQPAKPGPVEHGLLEQEAILYTAIEEMAAASG